MVPAPPPELSSLSASPRTYTKDLPAPSHVPPSGNPTPDACVRILLCATELERQAQSVLSPAPISFTRGCFGSQSTIISYVRGHDCGHAASVIRDRAFEILRSASLHPLRAVRPHRQRGLSHIVPLHLPPKIQSDMTLLPTEVQSHLEACSSSSPRWAGCIRR